MTLSQLKDLIHCHSHVGDATAVDAWFTHETQCRFQEWVPAPRAGEERLVDIGCCQPSIGYYFHLGWREAVGLFKEAGDCSREEEYSEGDRTARIVQADVEFERMPVEDGWADAVLMMEIFEHFGTDPMHALWEANRILKPSGRLIFSTPNATSFYNVWRILLGKAPYAGQEFNGFTTNRHNRIYDANELHIILQQAGFRIEAVASRSYQKGLLSRRTWGFYLSVSLIIAAFDGIAAMFSPRRHQRGEWLFVRAVKDGAPRERYPRSLYYDFERWGEWLAAVRKGRRQKAQTHG